MTSTSTTSSGSSGGTATAWNPQSPSTLMMANRTIVGGAGNGGGGAISAFYADDGVGCNDHETAALIRMLDARDDLSPTGGGDLRTLSKEYRRAVRDCMAGWEEHMSSRTSEEAQAGLSAEDEATNLELLKVSSAIMYLSEIYLLPRSGSGSGRRHASATTGSDTMDVDSSAPHDDNLPGSVTADTVRYLRLNHLPDVFDVVGTTHEEVNDMISSEQPEHYRGASGEGALFWSLIEFFAIRGCLAEAWSVLTHHSAVKRFSAAASRGDLDGVSDAGGAGLDDPVLLEDRDAFAILKGMMLGAPLPGGIDLLNDAGLDEEDDDDDVAMGLDQDDGDICLVPGVPRKSYQLWDDDGGVGDESSVKAGGDDALPGSFHPRAAANRHRTWSTAVSRAATQSGPLQSLMRRIPRLRRLLSILRGQFDELSSGGGGAFRSWDEALCAELLYVRPTVRPNDIHVRAQLAMKSHGLNVGGTEGCGTAVEEIVLSVMSGDAGKAVISLQGFGGSSGAALPATMVSLLCDLLTSAGRIQPSMLTYDLQTDLLLSASASILSSFAAQSQQGVGVRLSTRLLLPHATPSNVRVTATLAETLGRHWPRTDAEARGLLSMCEDMVLRGSVRIADAFDSICYCRYQHHVANGKPGGAAHWLMKGVEFWSNLRASLQEAKGIAPSLLEVELAGSSGRRFVTICTETARSLLTELTYPSEDLAHYHKIAKDMLEAIMEGELAHLVCRDQSAALLQHILDITDATPAGKSDVIAQNIVDCLDERVDTEGDGSVKILAPPSMHANLLSLALNLLEKEDSDIDKVVGTEKSSPSSSLGSSLFEVDGIQALMARFTQLTFNATLSPAELRAANLGGKKDGGESSANLPFEEKRMRQALCQGLKRAFVSENAKRKNDSSDSERLDAGIGRKVDLMLGPSM